MTGLLALGEFIFRGQSFYTFRRFPVLTRPFFVLPVAGSCTLLPPTTGCILGPLPWESLLAEKPTWVSARQPRAVELDSLRIRPAEPRS